ncbi:MAG: VanZ family protein [Anaerolineae bacterium]|nr:VanZ family protein [Anaerolineae bacterium]
MSRTSLWWAVAAIVAAWLLWMTLRPNPNVAAELSPLTTPASAYGVSPRLLISLAGNIAVFMPLGAAVAQALAHQPCVRRWLGGVIAGAALSLLIELFQACLPTRVAAVEDWLLNTAGAALGALLVLCLSRRRSGSPRVERVCEQSERAHPDQATEA